MKNCETCIHERVCNLKSEYKDCLNKINDMLDKLEGDNTFSFSLECPEWRCNYTIHTGIPDRTNPWKDIFIEREHPNPWAIKSDILEEPKICLL